MQKHLVIAIVVACEILVASGASYSKSLTVAIPIGDVDAHSGARGSFYVVPVPVPADVAGKRLDRVFVEFAVDARPTSPEDSISTPAIGVFPLTQSYIVAGTGGAPDVDASPVIESAVPSVRPVVTGENRVVKLDITAIVRGWLEDPSSNHGLVIGSLTGSEVAAVTLRSELPDGNGAVRVTFFYQNRFADRVPEQE